MWATHGGPQGIQTLLCRCPEADARRPVPLAFPQPLAEARGEGFGLSTTTCQPGRPGVCISDQQPLILNDFTYPNPGPLLSPFRA